MATAILKSVADKVRDSAYIMPIFFMVCIGLISSTILSINDYWTSYMGVISLPLRDGASAGEFAKLISWLSDVAMAATPDVTITVGGYILLTFKYERGQRWVWWLTLAVVAMAIWGDVQTGFLYYMPPASLAQESSVFWAYFRAGFVDTLGSNVIFVVCSGLFFFLIGDFMREARIFIRTIQGYGQPDKGKRKKQNQSGENRQQYHSPNVRPENSRHQQSHPRSRPVGQGVPQELFLSLPNDDR